MKASFSTYLGRQGFLVSFCVNIVIFVFLPQYSEGSDRLMAGLSCWSMVSLHNSHPVVDHPGTMHSTHHLMTFYSDQFPSRHVSILKPWQFTDS